MRMGKTPGEKRNVCSLLLDCPVGGGLGFFCPPVVHVQSIGRFDFLTEGKDVIFLYLLKGMTWSTVNNLIPLAELY